MAEVHKDGVGFSTLSAFPPDKQPVTLTGGRLRRVIDRVAVANGDSANSTYRLARVPSGAILSAASRLHHEALTGVTDADFGSSGNPDGLVDGASLASAGSTAALSAVAVSSLDQPLWKVLGLTGDPGGEIDLLVTLRAAASADGQLALELFYTLD